MPLSVFIFAFEIFYGHDKTIDWLEIHLEDNKISKIWLKIRHSYNEKIWIHTVFFRWIIAKNSQNLSIFFDE